MIKSREDYRYYLQSDKIALERRSSITELLFDDIWRFEKLLRKVEYYTNCKTSLIWKPYIFLLTLRFMRLSAKINVEIPPNVFGPGLDMAHRGHIIVNAKARIGRNCKIHSYVVIGIDDGPSQLAPRIGDNVYIGPGAKIYGGITVADNIAIGANSVVNKSFTEPGITIAGVPAKKVSDKGSANLLKNACLPVIAR